jgi:hypothetical protein
MPNNHANPHIGEAGVLEAVEEEHIEVVCDRAMARQVIRALKEAHPYEEVIIDVVPLIEVDQL